MVNNDGQWNVLGWWWGSRGRSNRCREGKLALALIEVVHWNPC